MAGRTVDERRDSSLARVPPAGRCPSGIGPALRESPAAVARRSKHRDRGAIPLLSFC